MLNPGDIFASVIRTAVPLVVGWFLAIPAIAVLGVDAEAATAAVTFFVTTGYYAVFRLLETHLHPRFGWLLGLAKPPTYPE